METKYYRACSIIILDMVRNGCNIMLQYGKPEELKVENLINSQY
jgi:hypothetical protein